MYKYHSSDGALGPIIGILLFGGAWLFFALISLCISATVLAGGVFLVITVLRFMGVAI